MYSWECGGRERFVTFPLAYKALLLRGTLVATVQAVPSPVHFINVYDITEYVLDRAPSFPASAECCLSRTFSSLQEGVLSGRYSAIFFSQCRTGGPLYFSLLLPTPDSPLLIFS